MTAALSKLNFRDVGGLPTATGGVLRAGIIFRCEGPASFAPIHRDELAALGIRLVCDLRAATERAKHPNDWAAGARLLNLDITADLRVQTSEGRMGLTSDSTAEATRQALADNYSAIPDAIRPHLRDLIVAIVEEETPVFVHCTAGKDRTGVMMALLLKALEVPDDIVFADYLRSDIFARNLRQRGGIHEQFEEAFGFRPNDALIDAMIGVDLAFLNAALDAIARDWGSVENYFTAAGIDASLMDLFRKTLIVGKKQL